MLKIHKVIRALPKAWKVKAITLKEFNDREKMDFSGFIENLKTHEMKMKVIEERETPKKKAKATPSSLMKKNHQKTVMRILPCSLEKWAQYFTKKEDKATFEEEDIKEDFKRRRRQVLTFIARGLAI